MPTKESLTHEEGNSVEGPQIPDSGLKALAYIQARLGEDGVKYASAVGRDHNGLITLFEGYLADDGSVSIGLSDAPMRTRRRLRGLGRNFLGRRSK